MNNRKQYCVISHTHWDREWYLPFESFRMRLVDLIDNLLDILDCDPDYRFHLDAQTIVLQDYLAIRPHRRARLEELIRAGSILVGPWYVQNDFHLTSGEATVRNLLLGSAIAEEFGGCMRIGYAADQFGLIAQLPQILRGFGLDTCVFGRGFDRGVSEFIWESEDGSSVLCEHMKFWYNNAQRFPRDPASALNLARDRGALCERFCKTSNFLLMNGVDHLEAQEDLMPILKEAQPLLDEGETFYQDTLPEFMARVKAEAEEKGIEFDTYRGEFRDNGSANVLSGTLSSRIHLKRENAYCQSYLEKRLEPLQSLTQAYGLCDFPLDYDHYLWKTLIENHPHDSICGCSVDPVHAHMEDRFARIRENMDDLLKRTTDSLLSHLDRQGLREDQILVLLLNPTQIGWKGTVEARVMIKVEEDTGAFTLTDRSGRAVPFTVTRVEKNLTTSVHSPINLPGGIIVNRYTLRISAGNLPPMSHKTLIATPVSGELAVTPLRKRPLCRMENEYLRVQIERNGTATVTDKRSGAVMKEVFLLEDSEDWGDSYNYAANPDDVLLTGRDVKAKIERIEDNDLIQKRRVSYDFPISHASDSGVIPVSMVLTLEKGVPYLGCEVTLENTVKEHRLRIRIPTGILSDRNYAGQPYDCIERDKISRFPKDETHPDTDYVGIENGERGVAVLNCGLYEYEHMTDDQGTLALTLVRATSAISCSHSGIKAVEEGWMTPGGEMLRRVEASLAVYPYVGDRISACVPQMAALLLQRPIAAVQSVDRNKFLGGRPFVQGPGMPGLFYRDLPHPEVVIPHEQSWLKLKSDRPGAIVHTAWKGAEQGEGKQVLRFFNTTSEPVDFTLTVTAPIRDARLAGLDEKPVGETILRGKHTVTLHAEPKQILTLLVTL